MSNEKKHNFGDNKKGGFNLPDNYFDSFMGRLQDRINAQSEDELSEFPLLKAIPKSNVFEVPQGYFENLKMHYNEAEELSTFNHLAKIPKTQFAVIEDSYFENLQKKLNHKIEIAEELKAYTTLYNANKYNPFDTPQGYFEDIDQRVKERIFKAKTSGVLEQFFSIVFAKKALYAYGLILVITIGVFYKINNTVDITPNDCQSFACLDKKDILNSTELNNLDEDELMEMIDVNQLSDSLKVFEKIKNDKESFEKTIEDIDEENIMDQL